ncbi:MAG TPA: hypothetical protein VFQ83_09995, partial [Candidatus Udaeobacter sp.]|nr:hypothetical protein [Candidatus Udaeobacter sp.]
MKKQCDLILKAHLIRGGFFLLLLPAICVIPFAPAQPGESKRSIAPRGDCPTPWTSIANMLVDVYGAA